MSKKNKQKSAERRRRQLDRFVKTLYEKKEEKIMEIKGSEKKEVIRARQDITGESKYLETDLRHVLILTGVLVLLTIILYFCNLKYGFLEPIANTLLKDIVK